MPTASTSKLLTPLVYLTSKVSTPFTSTTSASFVTTIITSTTTSVNANSVPGASENSPTSASSRSTPSTPEPGFLHYSCLTCTCWISLQTRSNLFVFFLKRCLILLLPLGFAECFVCAYTRHRPMLVMVLKFFQVLMSVAFTLNILCPDHHIHSLRCLCCGVIKFGGTL